MDEGFEAFREALEPVRAHEDVILSETTHATLPSPSVVSAAANSLYNTIPLEGLGSKNTSEHLLTDVAPGLNGSSLAATYYGFVTGGVTPAARIGEHLASLYDQNVSVHLPNQTISTLVEDSALCMLLELLQLNPSDWPVRTLTSGGTAGNVLGLASARNGVIRRRVRDTSEEKVTAIDTLGVLVACSLAGIAGWQILTCAGHSSLAKAANIVGLGSASVVDVGRQDRPVAFDIPKLRVRLSDHKMASIVVVSCGEVNTGEFSTHGEHEMQELRALCDLHGAWLHVDGAFGLFARCLSVSGSSIFGHVVAGAAGVELSDSIAGDGHKMLNVPYDCGFFFSRDREQQIAVFQNPNAAYLAGGSDNLPSPLNIGLENSRRFRGLPLYATLLAYGRQGYAAMVARQVRLSRRIARWIRDSPDYVLLPESSNPESETFIIVLFQAREPSLNVELTSRINATRKIYVSGTVWQGAVACRIAVANWQVDVDTHYSLVIDILSKVAQSAEGPLGR